MRCRENRPTFGEAIFDRSGAYRYSLTRSWSGGCPRVAFVLLNPNRADACLDDPTIRRCVGFARQWGFGSAEIVNLFALRTACPRDLARVPDPVGPENDAYLRSACRRADCVVVGWGNWGRMLGRHLVVRTLLGDDSMCLGLTKLGQPRHPLYLPASVQLVSWSAARAGS